MVRTKALIPVLCLAGCFADSPAEPPFAAPGQLSVSVALSSSELGVGDTIAVIVRVQNRSSDRLAYHGACPITVEFLDHTGSSALLHPSNCLAVRIVQVLDPGEVAETTYQFDGHVWTTGPSSQSYALSPGLYEVVASIERQAEFRSAPTHLEVH